MINCPKCKRENVDHSKFCYRCYARLTTPEPEVGTPSPASVPRPTAKGPIFESISVGMSKVKGLGKEAGRTAEMLARMGAPAKRQWNGCLEYLSNLFRRFQEVLSRKSQRVKEEPKRRVLLRSKEELQRISREVPKRISEVEPKRIVKQGPQGISREETQRISKVEPQKIRQGTQGVWMTVGELSFRVLKSEWVETLSAKKVLDKRPDASFLSILLTVRNDGKAPMTIPSFGLIDEGEAEYETFEKGWLIDNWLGRLERLNPGVGRSGVIVFDVPQAHRYRLKVLGGLWSQEYALIELEI